MQDVEPAATQAPARVLLGFDLSCLVRAWVRACVQVYARVLGALISVLRRRFHAVPPEDADGGARRARTGPKPSAPAPVLAAAWRRGAPPRLRGLTHATRTGTGAFGLEHGAHGPDHGSEHGPNDTEPTQVRVQVRAQGWPCSLVAAGEVVDIEVDLLAPPQDCVAAHAVGGRRCRLRLCGKRCTSRQWPVDK